MPSSVQAFLDGQVIEGSVIYAGTETTILIFHKKETGCSRRCGWTDESHVKGLFDKGVHSLILWNGKGIDPTLRG